MTEPEPEPRPETESAARGPETAEPVLPDRTTDETDVGWGDEEPFADDDIRRLTDELPPHHVDRD